MKWYEESKSRVWRYEFPKDYPTKKLHATNALYIQYNNGLYEAKYWTYDNYWNLIGTFDTLEDAKQAAEIAFKVGLCTR